TFAFFGNDLDAPSYLADTNWHHWAVTFDAVTNARTIYRDGIAVASDISSSDFLGTGTLKIGRAYNASINNFNGSLDEVRIWTIPRTQSEIQANMYNCLTGSESGLSAYYQFENGSGSSTLSDVTSNGNTGTLTNMNVNTAWNSGVSVCSSCNLEMTQTVTITVNNSATGTDIQTACNSYTWIDNNTYTASNNTATHTIVGGAANGCDSIVTLNLTINNPTTGTDVQTACNSYTWIDNNTYTASNNTAT